MLPIIPRYSLSWWSRVLNLAFSGLYCLSLAARPEREVLEIFVGITWPVSALLGSVALSWFKPGERS